MTSCGSAAPTGSAPRRACTVAGSALGLRGGGDAVLAFSDRYPSTASLINHLQHNVFAYLPLNLDRSGPVAVPTDRWNHLPGPQWRSISAVLADLATTLETGQPFDRAWLPTLATRAGGQRSGIALRLLMTGCGNCACRTRTVDTVYRCDVALPSVQRSTGMTHTPSHLTTEHAVSSGIVRPPSADPERECSVQGARHRTRRWSRRSLV